jgi:4-amino-4-deoxychorismate lyase
MDRWLINGELAESIPVSDRGLQYGDGLFETMAVRGGKIRLLEQHLGRLTISCKRLGIPTDCLQDLPIMLDKCIASAPHGTVKIIVTRGTGQRGYALPQQSKATLCIGFAADAITGTQPAPARVGFCATPIARNVVLAGLKTLNRLEQVMARAEWSADAGFDEGLMSNDRGEVVCGTMTNLFIVRENTLTTPLLDEAGVRGVMRSHVLGLAGDMNIKVHESHLLRADIESADAVFLTNALKGIWPVAEIAGQVVANSNLVTDLQAALTASFAAGDAG